MYFAINDRVITEIQNIMGSISLEHQDTESGTSDNNQESSERTNGLKRNSTKKDSRSAFDLRDSGDLSSYNFQKIRLFFVDYFLPNDSE